MTTQLAERLRDLADEAPGPLSPAGLWQTGRRLHRRRVATAAVLVGCLVALVGGAGYGDHLSRRPDPAAPPATRTGPMAIPDRFFQPSPWLPSTSKPGRLVAIIDGVTQQHLPFGSTSDAIVGVAAGSQRYSFLDLPDRAQNFSVALAPDGLHVAYWSAGSPNAVRILDVVTGRSELHKVHASQVLAGKWLLWTSDTTLGAEVNWVGKHHWIRDRVVCLSVGSQRVRALPRNSVETAASSGLPSGSWITISSHRVVTRDPITGVQRDKVRVTPQIADSADLNASGTWIAANANRGLPGVLLAGRVTKGHALMHRVGRLNHTWEQVLGWADETHVVAPRVLGRRLSTARLESVDVRSGRATTLSTYHVDMQVAADAVRHARSVPAVEPPRPWNWRWIIGLGLGALTLIVLFGYLGRDFWRQRVRR